MKCIMSKEMFTQFMISGVRKCNPVISTNTSQYKLNTWNEYWSTEIVFLMNTDR